MKREGSFDGGHAQCDVCVCGCTFVYRGGVNGHEIADLFNGPMPHAYTGAPV